MSATLRRLHFTSIKVCNSSSSLLNLCTSRTLVSTPPNPLSSQSFNNLSSSTSTDHSFDFLEQFSPFQRDLQASSSDNVINSNERRKIIVTFAKMIKDKQGFILKAFSHDFCPFFLARIMRFSGEQQVAFAFFKWVFRDFSDLTIKSSCIACHVLAMEGLRILAQNMLWWMISRIGVSRSRELVEFMWSGHRKYESDFSVLDSLMRAFLKAEMESPAMEVLGRMRGIGKCPSLSAMSVLFRLLFRIGDYGSVFKLFRDMVGKGPRPSNITFNVMIHGFCRKGFVEIGHSLLHLMGKFQCEPDVFTYNILINACCIRGQTSDALDWMDEMIGKGCNPNTVTFCTLIDALCKEGNIVEARKIFDGMPEKKVCPNTVIYNALIGGYVKSREIDEANMLYGEMKDKGIAPDVVTFNILVAGYHKYGREDDESNLSRDLSLSGLDCSLGDMLVAKSCWAGQLGEATKLLENLIESGVPLTVIAFNSVIAAYSKHGLEEAAFEAYDLMIKYGLSPSYSTCNSLLMCLSRRGKLQEAENLMNKMRDNDFPVNRVAFTVLLDGYFKAGDMVGAHHLWNKMRDLRIAPDAVAFSAFIDGLSKAGLVEDAYDIFLEMKSRGLVPNNFVYNSLLAGFCNSGKLNEALQLEREMRQRGVPPDHFTSNIIINGYCKQGRMKSAIDTFMEMHRFGLKPDIVSYNTLISGYCKTFDMDNADNIVYNMYNNGWDPDVFTYNIRIHGFCTSGRVNRSIMVLDELLLSGLIPSTVTYNIMLNVVCSDVLDRATILTAKLLKIAFVPNTVTSNLLMSHLCKQGLPGRARMWGQILRQIGYSDQITDKILDRAEHDMQKHSVYLRGTSGESHFVDFLMYLTYDYLHRIKLDYEPSYSHPKMYSTGLAC